MAGTQLRGERVVLRPLRHDDVPRLVQIGAEPEVARWWPRITAEELLAKVERSDDVTAFAVDADGELIGLAQFSENDDPEYRHAGIDLFLTSERHGEGLGRDVVRTLARYLVSKRGHHRITIDPAAANERAIRCYESVGFKRIGVLRRYWRAPDGIWMDGVLFDLLADEL